MFILTTHQQVYINNTHIFILMQPHVWFSNTQMFAARHAHHCQYIAGGNKITKFKELLTLDTGNQTCLGNM